MNRTGRSCISVAKPPKKVHYAHNKIMGVCGDIGRRGRWALLEEQQDGKRLLIQSRVWQEHHCWRP